MQQQPSPPKPNHKRNHKQINHGPPPLPPAQAAKKKKKSSKQNSPIKYENTKELYDDLFGPDDDDEDEPIMDIANNKQNQHRQNAQSMLPNMSNKNNSQIQRNQRQSQVQMQIRQNPQLYDNTNPRNNLNDNSYFNEIGNGNGSGNKNNHNNNFRDKETDKDSVGSEEEMKCDECHNIFDGITDKLVNYYTFETHKKLIKHYKKHNQSMHTRYFCFFKQCPLPNWRCSTSEELRQHIEKHHNIPMNYHQNRMSVPSRHRPHPQQQSNINANTNMNTNTNATNQRNTTPAKWKKAASLSKKRRREPEPNEILNQQRTKKMKCSHNGPLNTNQNINNHPNAPNPQNAKYQNKIDAAANKYFQTNAGRDYRNEYPSIQNLHIKNLPSTAEETNVQNVIKDIINTNQQQQQMQTRSNRYGHGHGYRNNNATVYNHQNQTFQTNNGYTQQSNGHQSYHRKNQYMSNNNNRYHQNCKPTPYVKRPHIIAFPVSKLNIIKQSFAQLLNQKRLKIQGNSNLKNVLSSLQNEFPPPFYQIPMDQHDPHFILLQSRDWYQLWIYGDKGFREAIFDQLSDAIHINYGPFNVK